MKMAGPHIFCLISWGGVSPVNSIYFNWYIFALSLFLYAILRGSPLGDSRTRDLMTLTQLKDDSGFVTPLT